MKILLGAIILVSFVCLMSSCNSNPENHHIPSYRPANDSLQTLTHFSDSTFALVFSPDTKVYRRPDTLSPYSWKLPGNTLVTVIEELEFRPDTAEMILYADSINEGREYWDHVSYLGKEGWVMGDCIVSPIKKGMRLEKHIIEFSNYNNISRAILIGKPGIGTVFLNGERETPWYSVSPLKEKRVPAGVVPRHQILFLEADSIDEQEGEEPAVLLNHPLFEKMWVNGSNLFEILDEKELGKMKLFLSATFPDKDGKRNALQLMVYDTLQGKIIYSSPPLLNLGEDAKTGLVSFSKSANGFKALFYAKALESANYHSIGFGRKNGHSFPSLPGKPIRKADFMELQFTKSGLCNLRYWTIE